MSSKLRLRATASSSRPILRSLSPITPTLHLARGCPYDSNLTASPSRGRHRPEEEPSSPTTQDTRSVVMSVGKLRDLSPVDALVARVKKRSLMGVSPMRETGPEDPVFPVASYEKKISTAEEEVRQTLQHLTVKELGQLVGLKIPSREMEKTMTGLLALCAEIDSGVEVGGLSRVLSSRTWPTVLRYLRSPGQVVQTLRAVVPAIMKGKIGKAALVRAAEAVASINEAVLREEAGGTVGLQVCRYIRSVLRWAKAWETSSTSEKTQWLKRGHKGHVQSLVPDLPAPDLLMRTAASPIRTLLLDDLENSPAVLEELRLASTLRPASQAPEQADSPQG